MRWAHPPRKRQYPPEPVALRLVSTWAGAYFAVPIVASFSDFIGGVLDSLRMTVIVRTHISVTIETQWYAVLEGIWAAFRCVNYMMQFHLQAAMLVAKATAPLREGWRRLAVGPTHVRPTAHRELVGRARGSLPHDANPWRTVFFS